MLQNWETDKGNVCFAQFGFVLSPKYKSKYLIISLISLLSCQL